MKVEKKDKQSKLILHKTKADSLVQEKKVDLNSSARSKSGCKTSATNQMQHSIPCGGA